MAKQIRVRLTSKVRWGQTSSMLCPSDRGLGIIQVAAPEASIPIIPSRVPANGGCSSTVDASRNRKLGEKLGLNGQKYVSENLATEKIGERVYEAFVSAKL